MGLLRRLIGRTRKPSAAVAPDPPQASPPHTPRFAVIDVETTGLSPVDERIIELAIIRADEHGRPIDQWASRVHPEKPVGAAHLHGLADADLESAPRFSELALTLGSALQGLVVVAHHTEFDNSFLRAEFARASLPAHRI